MATATATAPEGVSGLQKAAILMTLLGEEAAAHVLKHLEQDEVRRITMEIAKIRMIDPTQHGTVLHEFLGLVAQARGLELAGPPLARRLLERAMPEQAVNIELEPRRVRDADEEGTEHRLPELPDSLVGAPSHRLALLLKEESHQTVALFLAHLPPRKAARVLSHLAPELRLEVTRRMASIREIRPQVVARMSQVLETRLQTICDEPMLPVDGVQTAADTLTKLGRAAGKEIVEALAEEHPELAKQLRDMLFTFDMLRGMNERDTQEVLRQIDRSSLALALKGADPELQQQFMNNMSERAAQMLQEEMDLLGAPKLAEIDRAQRAIIDVALKLESEGVITLQEQGGASE
ncbi:MAG: flagellar motor switch protein FliG [Acidobacteria bacterium]|nr:flagellar motor switch protein FliG [Acidobacteriota bacterium]